MVVIRGRLITTPCNLEGSLSIRLVDGTATTVTNHTARNNIDRLVFKALSKVKVWAGAQ